jgi:F0F1-type ATP synthase assembly protein I
MKSVGPILLVVGLVLIGISFAFGTVVGSATAVSDEEVEEYSEAAADLHAAVSPGLTPDDKEERAKRIAEAEAKMAEADKKAKAAERTKQLGTWGFRITGVVLAVAGCFLHIWASQSD